MSQQINIRSLDEIKKIQDIVKKLQNYGNFEEVYREWKIEEILDNFINEFNWIEKQLKNVQDKINQTTTSLYFFGKLSSGKTKLINGIIGDELFLSSHRLTTNCSVHIRKSEFETFKAIYKGQEYLYQNKKEALMEIAKISTCKQKSLSDKNKFIELLIPVNNDNKILKENVELIDSSGLENNWKKTECIQNYVIDVDIFIFVLDHDITEEDERIFKFQVEQYSTKPNIYILINKWDKTDSYREKALEKSYKSLFSKSYSLISQYSGPEAINIENRIYFVSAKELSKIRINKKYKYLSDPKQKARYDNFEKFENEISEYLQDPYQNKIRRYNIDIQILKDKMNKNFIELATWISNIDYESFMKIYEDSKNNILKFKESLQRKCQKLNSECKDKIECSVTKMYNSLNFDSNEINTEIEEYYSQIDKSILNLTTYLDCKYSKLIAKIENIGDVNVKRNVSIFENFSKIDPITHDNNLNKKGKIKQILDYNPLAVSQTAIMALSLIPIVSFIATNIYLFRMKSSKKQINESKIIKLNREIHRNDEEKLKTLDENISKIENYFTAKVDQLLKQINDKIKLRNDYREYLMNLFN